MQKLVVNLIVACYRNKEEAKGFSVSILEEECDAYSPWRCLVLSLM